MKPITKTYLLLFTCLFLLAACQKEEDVPAPYTETVQLIISVPASASTRIGDPGEPVDEGADWDRLAVILAYTEGSEVTLPGGSKVQVTAISKDDFEKLPLYGNTQYRLLAIDAQPGTVNIYGVTYSSDAAQNPESAIEACKDNAAVQALTISNDYASTSQNAASKFVSVATGYYKTTVSGNQPAEFTIQEGGTGQVGGTIPTMTLTRLAAKIDIQWDAADAYDKEYTDVKVTGFSFDSNNVTVTDSGNGRLFPTLNSSSTGIAGKKTFYNTSEISQRNGRVYHYTFPDGVSVPSVKFNITANNESDSKNYTLNFQEALKQATWYKVNATIKGITGSDTITFGDNSGTSVGS
ncbi:hypothetical protein [Mediterranea massiliensis]|uniref:hypothetical protein n=1 Tax=Mediterranea massiliensis TaxID=1841865 RepID=UPI0025A3BCFD|nr:hypothetical protein [Mediterranea massiliensis]MDM8337141.1 hypothetical protein [Mediterranea massiliensis]